MHCIEYTIHVICVTAVPAFVCVQYAQWKFAHRFSRISSSLDVARSLSLRLTLHSSINLFCTRSSPFDFPSILLSHTTTAAAAAASVVVFPHFFFALRFFSLHFFQWPVGMCACACVLSYAVITHQCHFERWKAHTSHSFSIPICHHKNPWPLSLFICRFGHLVGGKCFNSCNNFFPTEFVFPPVFCSRECVLCVQQSHIGDKI